MATAAAPANWQPIGEIVAGFRSECSEFEHLVQSLFDQLDQLRSELDRKMHDVERERQRVAERERQLSEQRKETSRIAHQFEHQEAKLSEALTELDELKSLINRAAEETSQRESLVESQIEKQLEGLQRDRETLQKQLTDAQAELTKHATLARDLAAARKELADARAELARGGRSGGSGEDSEELAELADERAALEAELELVRGRAAELYESLAQERKALLEHKSESATELKQLRRIVEKQAELLSEKPAAAPAPVHVSSEKPARSRTRDAVDDIPDETVDSPASDPVISSVMAQFAKLQKEVAERRKHRKSK